MKTTLWLQTLATGLFLSILSLTGVRTVHAQSNYEPYSFGTLAGLPLTAGSTDDSGSLAWFNEPWGLAVDGAGNVYVADTLNHTIRKITPSGVVTTLAGVAGSSGFNNGASGTALFNRPTGVAVNGAGTVVYVADYNNQLIREISAGVVSTLAGSVGVVGGLDGTGSAAQFGNPFGVALNNAGTMLYVTDQNNQTIRGITVPGAIVSTLAGAAGVNGSTDDPANNLNARFNTPRGIAVDSNDDLYVADAGNFTVRKILSTGGVSTLAGAVFTPGFDDGAGSVARFSSLSPMSPFGGPCGVAVDSAGNIYVTDQGSVGNGYTIRKITPGGNVTTLAGAVGSAGSADGTGSVAQFNYPGGVAVDGAGNLYVADTANHTIRVGVKADDCPNLILNGSFEVTSPVVAPNTFNNSLDPLTGVPGWTTTSGKFLEVWSNTMEGLPASHGTNHLEINARSDDQTVSQVVTGLSVDCPVTFCFDYTGRFGQVGGTPNNDFTITISSGGVSASVPLNPAAYATGGWLTFCTNFVPIASTVTISFRGQPHFSDGTIATQGGAHIDNISLTQCCDTDPEPPVPDCATEKTVECGTAWDFDPPAFPLCDPEKLTISVLSTVTNNSSCSTVITRTWQVTGCCGSGTEGWSPLGAGVNGEVWALAEMGGNLYAGGHFTTAGGASANHVASWDGTSWSPLGSGVNNGVNGPVFALAVMGGKLFAAGYFTTAGGASAENIAEWNGTSWSPLGSGLVGSGAIEALAVMGTDLYAGGAFTDAGGVAVNHIAKWDSVTGLWSALGSGVTLGDRVNALAVIGTDVYAGGQITGAGGVSVNHIAKWNGSTWSALGSGLDLPVGGGLGVLGGNLYAGGSFTIAGGTSAHRVARWDVANSTWSPLGTGVDAGGVEGFAVIGTELYVSGGFIMAGGVTANRVARWDGATWSALGSGMNDGVWRLAVIGTDLYAGGVFTTADGQSANYVAKWDGYCPPVSLTCSQTVTVIDRTPPVITCTTGRIIVALGKNCEFEIPTIRPAAIDKCTPRSQLVYSQTPAAGTIVSGPCQLVTITVRDACDNASTCEVMVCGIDKTPPTLICPKSVTVTDCTVPDVLALVSASDNCTASNKLIFTQSPAAGTAIAAGGNQVSVTVTDLEGNTATCIIPLITSGAQSILSGLFNTGVDASQAVLSGGDVDPHYSLDSVPAGTPTGPGYYNAPDAIVATSPWGLPPFTSSRWIAPGANTRPYPAGAYTYSQQFVLPSGADPLTASISGRWAADDGAGMFLNGVAPANQVSAIATSSPAGYAQWTHFTVSSGFVAFPAVNTLYFVVTNSEPDSAETGLRVEFTDVAVNCSTCTPPVILLQSPDQSLPLDSTAVFNVTVGGTPAMTYQWYHNDVLLPNGGPYSGATTPTLTIAPLSYTDAGIYHLVASSSCGEVTSRPRKLTVTKGWPWPWAWWNFSQRGSPLKATVGPDLILTGRDHLGLSSGTTRDFDLPDIDGKIANVAYVPRLPEDTMLELRAAALYNPIFGATNDLLKGVAASYTFITDAFVPGDSTAGSTLFTIFDRWGNLVFGTDGEQNLSLAGNIDDVPFNLISSSSLRSGEWNRVALVVDDTGCRLGAGSADPNTGCGDQVTLTLYLNGQPAGSTTLAGAAPFTFESLATVISSPDGTASGVYVSSIQFHAVAMPPEMIAGIGSPANGLISANDTATGLASTLSITRLNGVVEISWDNGDGSDFRLEETLDLTSGVWVESMLPFDQSELNGSIITTVYANPAKEGPAKFYRHKYKGIVTLIR